MPKLERSEWYDLCRDMNWQFKYVTDAEVFPEALSQSHGIPAVAWWNWDEPYKSIPLMRLMRKLEAIMG